jgi:uncharacterized protein (TIGR03437 family)
MCERRLIVCRALLAALFLAPAVLTLPAAPFGKVVAIGGHAADIALDEARGVLYIANFTGNRIEVMSLSDSVIQSSINVAANPGALALSPDGKHLVITHYGNFTPPASSANSLTIINLEDNTRRTIAMGAPPLGVAFGIDNRALVVTTGEFLQLDPSSGVMQVLDTIQGVSSKLLPVAPGNFPTNIVASSMTSSGDGSRIYGIVAGGTADNSTIEFSFEVATGRLKALGVISQPALGPRVLSVNHDGSRYVAGWALHNTEGVLLAQFPNPSGVLNIGSSLIDTQRNVIFAQMTTASTTGTTTPGTGGGTGGGSGGSGGTGVAAGPPILQIVDADNLAVLERLLLPENLAGRSVLNAGGNTIFAVSESGVVVLPIARLGTQPRVAAASEDVVFRGNFCDRRVSSAQITILDPGGNRTPFQLISRMSGVTVSPSVGVTPATVTVRVDPTVFLNARGTASGTIDIVSQAAVNVPSSIRVLINNKEPDQRGMFANIPGRLVDILADPGKDRFFILRQDSNQVLVFDGASYAQVAALKTGNTPTQMAISFDRRWLLIGHDNSQIVSVFDLETLQPSDPIVMPFGHYPRSVASSGRATLAASRVAGPANQMSRIDLDARIATVLPSLGVFENKINLNTVLVASGNGSSILAAHADGTLQLYNANTDSFTVSRKDFTALSGAYAASSFDQFLVGNTLLNASLVRVRDLDASVGQSSGFAFVDQSGLRAVAASASSPGVIQRVTLPAGEGLRSTRMAEAPLLSDVSRVFTRTLAPLYSRQGIVALTTSGITVLPWQYDAAVAPPQIDRVENAADPGQPFSPGGLIALRGRNLSPVNQVSSTTPLPTALGESCLTVNGVAVPMFFVSPEQINAQLPYQIDGSVAMTLRTPGGVSDNLNLTLQPAAPSVFRNGAAGPETRIPTIIRTRNNELVTVSNPLHREDVISIYLAGMGNTSPAVEAGVPVQMDPVPVPVILPTLRIGNADMEVLFAGLAPGQIGVYQINARVPSFAPLGFAVPLSISQGGQSTTVDVRVVP